MVECLKAKTAQWGQSDDFSPCAGAERRRPQQREQLRTAQRLWVAYRDANCLYDGEGTIARIDAGEGMRNLTEARAHELENIDHQ
jgi:uncharacterized protein YecT (DUF1311 family)